MSWIDQLLDPILNRMRGERLGVLGERGVGKTHLQTFLRDGSIPATYLATQTQSKLSPSRAQLWSFEDSQGKPESVRLRGGYDVPGSAGAVEAWKEVLDSATILLYLFRADLVFEDKDTHLRRIREDADLVYKLINDRPSSAKKLRVALVGTHYDLILGYQGPEKGASFYKWHVAMEDHADIRNARMVISGAVDEFPVLVVGSMGTLEDTRDLAYRLFARELGIGQSARS
jgi:hypothetical protein